MSYYQYTYLSSLSPLEESISSLFHIWRTAWLRSLRRATRLVKGRVWIWTHLSWPQRPCTSSTHSSVLLVSRAKESDPRARPAAPGVAVDFLPYGSKGKSKWHWKKSKCQPQETERQTLKALVLVFNASLWTILLLTCQGQFGNVCSWRWALTAPWHSLVLYIQWRAHRLSPVVTYLWDSPAAAELVSALAADFTRKKEMHDLGRLYFSICSFKKKGNFPISG